MKTAELKSGVIAGFKGIGKTSLYLSVKGRDLTTTLIDVSIDDYKDKPDFPNNYINKIKECTAKYAVILVDASPIVLDAMTDNGIFYSIIYPDITSMKNYLQRFNQDITKSMSEDEFKAVYEHIEKDKHPKIKMNGEDVFITKELADMTLVRMMRYFQNFRG